MPKSPGAPLTYFNDGGGGGGGYFFGSDILTKRDFFGPMKHAGIFLGRENNMDFFGYCISHLLKSTITKAHFTACVVLRDISEIVIYLKSNYQHSTKVKVGMF